MESVRIDDIDLQIQGILRDDARIGFSDIGASVGLSADAVRTRIGRLVGSGLLRIVGAVHPTSLGYFAMSTVWLRYPGPVSELVRQVEHLPNVTYLAEVVGPHNVLMEIAGADEEEVATTLEAVVQLRPGVLVHDVWRTLEHHKWHSQGRPETPVVESGGEIPYEDLSETDVLLLRALVQNPRATYRELAEIADDSYWSVRRRVQQLYATRTIRATAMLDQAAAGRMTVGNLAIRLVGDVDGALERICAIDEINIVSWRTGVFNALAEFACPTLGDLGRLSRRVAGLPGVAEVQVWPYVRVHIAAIPWLLEGR